MYYLQSRYYDANIGRFINADEQINEGVLGTNLCSYCENSPVVCVDPDGHSSVYVIYYKNNAKGEKGFDKQVKYSPYFNVKGKNVTCVGIRTGMEFIKAWNKMPKKIDRVFLYLHGDPGRLNFSDSGMYVRKRRKCNKVQYTFDSLKSVNVKEYVVLLSCYGFCGKNSVAKEIYKKTGSIIFACTGGVSYGRSIFKYARSSLKSPGNFYQIKFYPDGSYKSVKYNFGYMSFKVTL